MNIGIINKKQFTIGTGENAKVHKYLEMSIRPSFMESATFTVSPNKAENQNENAPDFNIYFSFNRKGEKYRRTKVGGIWNKTSDNGLEYKSGYIESPVFLSIGGKIHFSIFEAKPLDGEDPASITWSHDVVWSAPRPKETESQTSTSTNTYDQTPTINIDDEEMPF